MTSIFIGGVSSAGGDYLDPRAKIPAANPIVRLSKPAALLPDRTIKPQQIGATAVDNGQFDIAYDV